MAEIALLVNGYAYAGWKTARVTRSMESACGSFDLSVSDRWAGQDESWPIGEEDECTVTVNGATVLTGYVDRRSHSYSADSHDISVAGRDRAGDLVDCSVIGPPWEYRNTPVLTVAQRVAQPFGVSVSQQSGLTLPRPAGKLTIDPGDTAWDVIERACRTAGLLALSDGQGGLLLTRPGTTRATTELVEGQNILAASAEYDATGRYSRYLALGQHQGSDDYSGTPAARVKGEALDLSVLRDWRVLIVRPEGNVTAEHAKRRAEWEAIVRAARGDSINVTVQGWTQGDGALWSVNSLVRVRSPRIGVDGELLISEATYSAGVDGTTTQLTLRRPDAFVPVPTISKTSASNYWKEIVRGV